MGIVRTCHCKECGQIFSHTEDVDTCDICKRMQAIYNVSHK